MRSAAGIKDRVAGALMGAFVGDALGMGVHWYYDLEQMRRECGEWVDGYRDARPERYHAGLKAGAPTQAGVILRLTLEALLADPTAAYSEERFCAALDAGVMDKIDGTPTSGPGGYTSQSIRHAYRRLREEGAAWGDGTTASAADTTEAAERVLAYGARFAFDLPALADAAARNAVLTQSDETIVSLTVAYTAVLGMLVQGRRLDPTITDALFDKVHSGELPFHCVTGEKLAPPAPGAPEPPRAGRFASPDALITPSTCAAAAADPHISIEPAWRVSLVYGMPCAAYHILPACYYLAARFPDSFEDAVLHAVNGGGQNCARAMLTGALAGAQVGLSNIPPRFVEGLQDSGEILELVNRVGDIVEKEQSGKQ